MYPDLVSVMIERKYHEWLAQGKTKDANYCLVMVDPEYILDFSQMMQTHVFDTKRRRNVKRGQQGQRTVRPSDERFADNKNFLVGKAFRPIIGYGEGGKYDGSCQWLGKQFHAPLGYKPFPRKTVLEGIKQHQRDWVKEQLQKMKDNNKDLVGLT